MSYTIVEDGERLHIRATVGTRKEATDLIEALSKKIVAQFFRDEPEVKQKAEEPA